MLWLLYVLQNVNDVVTLICGIRVILHLMHTPILELHISGEYFQLARGIINAENIERCYVMYVKDKKWNVNTFELVKHLVMENINDMWMVYTFPSVVLPIKM